MDYQIFKFGLNGKIIFSKPLKSDEYLNKIREKISKNNIEKEDEDKYTLENILNNDEIKIKKNSQSIDALPPKHIKKEREFITKKGKQINSKKIKITNFSKYDVIKKKDDFIIYKYSNIKPHSPKELVYQYFFDSYEVNDYDNAYIILFC